MLAKIQSGAVSGLDAIPVTIEVDIASSGLPSFTIVGLPDKAIEESKERVRSAIKNSGAEFPPKRIVVNLAPADIPKVGPAYDLPIALGILIASGQILVADADALFVGELSLDGTLRHTNGILPFTLLARAYSRGSIYVPAVDALEASIIKQVTIYPVDSLLSLFFHLSNRKKIAPVHHLPFQQVLNEQIFDFDMSDIQGQEHAKRAIEIAAAGGHNLFMQGPPGAGKTMLARTIPSILPRLTEKEAIEVTKIYSVTGNLPPGQSVMKKRPFRSPHHTTSRIGLIGGGTHPMPGEISLAHRGVLFLDEFPEFPRHVLEALRQPMEDGLVSISRAAGTVFYPASFMLVGAANPCPCGNYGSETKRCICLPGSILRYRKRVSGPILDRIDLHITVPAVPIPKITDNQGIVKSSNEVQKKVQFARDKQTERFAKSQITHNAEMSTRAVKTYCQLMPQALMFMRQAAVRFNLTARGYYRILKVARTIADLDGARDIALVHIAEALQYRMEEIP